MARPPFSAAQREKSDAPALWSRYGWSLCPRYALDLDIGVVAGLIARSGLRFAVAPPAALVKAILAIRPTLPIFPKNIFLMTRICCIRNIGDFISEPPKEISLPLQDSVDESSAVDPVGALDLERDSS